MSRSFRVGIGGKRDYRKHQATAELINKAVVEHTTVSIVYRGKHKPRDIDPYHVWFMGGTIYVVAYCHERGAIRLFVLDRIEKAQFTGQKFELPCDFSMDDFTGARFRVSGGDGLTKVRIKFFPSVAEYIKEWTWHPSQVITEEKGGSIVLTLNVEGLFEVKNWVMSFGKRAKVLEPLKLAKDIANESVAITKLYNP